MQVKVDTIIMIYSRMIVSLVTQKREKAISRARLIKHGLQPLPALKLVRDYVILMNSTDTFSTHKQYYHKYISIS